MGSANERRRCIVRRLSLAEPIHEIIPVANERYVPLQSAMAVRTKIVNLDPGLRTHTTLVFN